MPKRKRKAAASPATAAAADSGGASSSSSAASEPPKAAPAPTCTAEETLRFELELEFVQCLANTHYIHHLAMQGCFDDEKFVAYLRYLHSYWPRPEYARFLTFPHCLHFLRLLQVPSFRESAKNAEFCARADHQQYLHYLHSRTEPYVDPKAKPVH